VTPAERTALADLEARGLHDVVRDRWPDARIFTYWDYRAGMFHQDMGMRIDLVLGTAPVAAVSSPADAKLYINGTWGKGLEQALAAWDRISASRPRAPGPAAAFGAARLAKQVGDRLAPYATRGENGPDPLAAPLGKIDVGPGNVLLLRYANLGSHDRGLSILNHRQSVLAEDSNILRNPTNVATQWLTAGQVSDAFVMIDPQSPYQTHIPIFESGYHLNNGAGLGLGGAMSYLDVVSGVAGVPSGPLSTVTVPAPTNTGTQPLSFTATIAAFFSRPVSS